MAGFFNFIGWVIILMALVIGSLGLTAGALGFTIGLGVIAGGLLVGVPFIAIGEVMNRLSALQALQARANELHEQTLRALTRPEQPAEPPRELPGHWEA